MKHMVCIDQYLETQIAIRNAVWEENPPNMLELLMSDEVIWERTLPTLVHIAPIDMLNRISIFARKALIKNIARSSKTPENILKKLASHSDREICKLVAKNINTSEETLLLLAKCNDANVKMLVAINPRLPIASLLELVRDCNKDVQLFAKEALQSRNMLQLTECERMAIAVAKFCCGEIK